MAICDVLRPYWTPGLADVSGNPSTPLKGWLSDGKFVFSGNNGASQGFTFYKGNESGFLESIAHDTNRMATVALESICGVPGEQELTRSSAWTLIRAYYAAFFSVHALGRMFGECVIQFESAQVTAINKAIHDAGLELKVTEGLHLLTVDPSTTVFSVTRLSRGAHEDTWSQFGNLLKRLSSLALNTPYVDARSCQMASVFLDDLLEILKTHPCNSRFNWLSYVRNEINYQHRYGAWFPHTGAKKFRDYISENVANWKKEPTINLKRDMHQLQRFVVACSAIVALARELMCDMAMRNSDGDSFLKQGALRVLRQISFP